MTPGDVVQINPDHRTLGGCLAIVESVHAWGIVANVPVARDKIAPVRLGPSEYGRIGQALWIRICALTEELPCDG